MKKCVENVECKTLECKPPEGKPEWYQVAGIVFFYTLILIVGIYATRRGKKVRRMSMDLAQDSMVAGRNIGLLGLSFK